MNNHFPINAHQGIIYVSIYSNDEIFIANLRRALEQTGLPISLDLATEENQNTLRIFIYDCTNNSNTIVNNNIETPAIFIFNATELIENLPGINGERLVFTDITDVQSIQTLNCCIKAIQVRFGLDKTIEKFHLLTKATNHIVWDWQLNKRIALWMGNGLQTVLHHEENIIEVDSDYWENNLHPDDRDRVVKRLDKIIAKANDNTWEDEYRFKTTRGDYRHIYDRGFIIYEKGKLIRMIGTMEDVTDRKLTELAIKQSEENYRNLFNNIPLPTYIWDSNTYEICETNHMALTEFGYSREEFLTKTILDTRPAKDVKSFKTFIRDFNNQPALKYEKQFTLVNKSGEEMIMQVRAFKINFKGRKAILSIATNITEKLELEKYLRMENFRKQQQIAEAVVTAQEKERTHIAMELHDNVNQLLSASRLYIEASKDNKQTSHQLLEQASSYIMNAIEEIRVLSRALTTPGLHERGFLDSIKNIANELSLLNGIQITVKHNPISEDLLDENFKQAIFRIVQEHLSNILKHSQASQAEIIVEQNDKTFEMQIVDNGRGHDLSAKRKGMGISNIYSRAALYNGEVALHSSPGKGFKIGLNFPLENLFKL